MRVGLKSWGLSRSITAQSTSKKLKMFQSKQYSTEHVLITFGSHERGRTSWGLIFKAWLLHTLSFLRMMWHRRGLWSGMSKVGLSLTVTWTDQCLLLNFFPSFLLIVSSNLKRLKFLCRLRRLIHSTLKCSKSNTLISNLFETSFLRKEIYFFSERRYILKNSQWFLMHWKVSFLLSKVDILHKKKQIETSSL